MVVDGSGYYDEQFIALPKLVLACEFDNLTPYRDETIDKKRPRRGLMNRGEADDSVAPIGEVIGWIVL